MTKTNFSKLVRWDADYYKSLTDNDCIVCLTEREVYIIGQITDALRWKNTRWIGDIIGLDFDLIASNLEYKLSERMTCQNIGTLLQKITQLEAKIDYVFNETVVNEGDTVFNPNTTVIDDVHSPAAMQTGDMTVQADTCDNAGKNQIYGAVNQVVRYITQGNQDFLENIEQDFGNLADQIETVLSAFPPTDVIAADEIAKWTQFIVEELQEEYAATVTETLIQDTICDIFCIAVANNCKLTMWDIFNYFGSKVSPTFSNAVSTFWDLVQFALVGSFSGNEYYYYMCYFQLVSAAFAGAATGDGLEAYERQIAAGFNSPDADWEIHCIACPTFYRFLSYDFALGKDGWEINPSGVSSTKGVWDGNRWKGTLTQFNEYLIQISLDTHNPTHRLRGIKFHLTRENGLSDGSRDTSAAWLRPTINSSTGQIQIQSGSFLPNGDIQECDYRTSSPFYWSGGNQIFVQQTIASNGETANLYLTKIDMLYDMNYAPERAIVTEDDNICD